MRRFTAASVCRNTSPFPWKVSRAQRTMPLRSTSITQGGRLVPYVAAVFRPRSFRNGTASFISRTNSTGGRKGEASKPIARACRPRFPRLLWRISRSSNANWPQWQLVEVNCSATMARARRSDSFQTRPWRSGKAKSGAGLPISRWTGEEGSVAPSSRVAGALAAPAESWLASTSNPREKALSTSESRRIVFLSIGNFTRSTRSIGPPRSGLSRPTSPSSGSSAPSQEGPSRRW